MTNLNPSPKKQISAESVRICRKKSWNLGKARILSQPVIIVCFSVGLVAITAIALQFPGTLEITGGKTGFTFRIDGGGKK